MSQPEVNKGHTKQSPHTRGQRAKHSMTKGNPNKGGDRGIEEAAGRLDRPPTSSHRHKLGTKSNTLHSTEARAKAAPVNILRTHKLWRGDVAQEKLVPGRHLERSPSDTIQWLDTMQLTARLTRCWEEGLRAAQEAKQHSGASAEPEACFSILGGIDQLPRSHTGTCELT